ncbi:hypothetical protein V6N13_112243 [Hibiscus sabdariffa]|uniref:Uncharacterized protein n=1 Tax=Hibiscus sabdariffa TaxID=183260 RepID=A0ABR2TML7_9ROSI
MGHGFSLLLLATPNFSYLQLLLNQIWCNIDGSYGPEGGHSINIIPFTAIGNLTLPAAAKRQGNGTRVQMIVSDKSLGKHLQKELARLEAKLRTPESTSASCLQSLMIKKELKIQEGSNQCGPSGKGVRCLSFDNETVPGSADAQPRNTVGRHLALGQSASMTDPSVLVHEIRKLEQRQRRLGEEANRALEVLHKEVSSHRLGNKEAAEALAKMLSEVKDMQAISSIPEDVMIGHGTNLKEEITRLQH